ncbi:c-type cytochrome biogenesis protein CcmI [Thalassolituus sp. LLYu03]|uniref:c-type cytochrome biogenesis protein CcmI n=1 Tax=Thalassolituus sp. LLYu03 TaxID=3421656 RepID=UPI003D2B0317
MIVALIVLSVILLVFLLAARGQAPDVVVDQSEENRRLYRERSDELAVADLDDEQKAALQLELDREFLAAADASPATGVPHNVPRNAQPDVRRWPLLAAMLAVVLTGTVLLYQFWGAGNELRATALLNKASEAELTEGERTELLERLQQASAHNSKNGEWIYLYGRLLTMNGDFAKAADVFADILVTLPQEAREDRAAILTMLAQARFFAAGQKADPAIYALLQESLTLQPGDRQTQGLAGMLAFELGNFAGAVEHWKNVWLSLPDSPEAQMLEQGIRRAAERMTAQGDTPDLSWLVRAQLKVLVDLTPQARAAVAPSDTVFVLARAVSGPPMPLAVQKLTVAQLPQVVTLSDAQAMAPGLNLSNHEQVTLIARVSKSGQPLPQAGDWQIEQTPVSNREAGVITLTISQSVP